jgi:hypothetical protein
MTIMSILLPLTIFIMLTLPGWMLLALSGSWRRWEGLQRWIVAIGISIAFYPVLFYWMRSVLPFLALGPYKLGALLIISAILIIWRMHRHWRDIFSFDRLEWIAIGIFAMTLFTRLWIIRDYPYPAWADSLHHSILTQLTAEQGRLPIDMEPYSPVTLDQYHLGLYALAAPVKWLTQVPAHKALLWISQALNGLCGAGVYLVLDRRSGHLGAIVGAAVVGLISHQPAFYVNWGRFTQVASQAILLIAWLETRETLTLWKLPWKNNKGIIVWNTFASAILAGAVFLLHFRVAAFYILLLIPSVLWELYKSHAEKLTVSVALGTTLVAVLALITIAPTLWKAVIAYANTRLGYGALAIEEIARNMQSHYSFNWNAVPTLTARPGLIVLASLGTIIGLLRRDKLVVNCVIWIVALCFLANAYMLNIPILSITNMGAVLIMLYLPIGLVVGSATERLVEMIKSHLHLEPTRVIVTLILIMGFITSHLRVKDVEPFRFFITPADLAAMEWIKSNTPPDSQFAINTYMWRPTTPHGTDAGYWIPYFTRHHTTADTMLVTIGQKSHISRIAEMSQSVERLEIDNSALVELQSLGVDYIYIGKKGDFSGPGLDVERLMQSENIDVCYHEAGVSILRIKPEEKSDSLKKWTRQ